MLTAETTPTVLPYVKAGKLRAVGIASNTRIPFLPEVPTLDEQGVSGYDVRAWTGLVAPAGTPAAILERMNKEVAGALATSEMKKRLYDLSLVAVGNTRDSSAVSQIGDREMGARRKTQRVVRATRHRI
jgi:tripartite-type tricarboxylate transporter receptor subunit TctC